MSENPFEYQGRIGIHVEKSEYTIAPVENTIITVLLRNQGLDDDSFFSRRRGLHAAQILSSLPAFELAPGEEKETDLIIQAHSLSQNKSGVVRQTRRATSQQHPEQSNEVKLP